MAKDRITPQQEVEAEQDVVSQHVAAQSNADKNAQMDGQEGAAKANEDGTISFRGAIIGPFTGEWQGIMRNKIIASHLSELTDGDLQNTKLEPSGEGVRISLGDIEFSLLNSDLSAMDVPTVAGKSPGYSAALHVLGQLGATPPAKTMEETRGELALKQAKMTYLSGREKVGNGSWETRGPNSGPLLDEINAANHAGRGLEWCGMFVGHAYKKAGIRPEILKNLVFWSGYRLYMFFTKGVNVQNKSVGSFWQPHQYENLPVRAGKQRKEKLDAFAPRAGDVVLFRSDYSHVAMVSSYNAETGVLELMEGNSGNKVQATAFGSDAGQITFIGRFNASDYGGDPESALVDAPMPNVVHNDSRSGRTT